jgi:hypothetical protein
MIAVFLTAEVFMLSRQPIRSSQIFTYLLLGAAAFCLTYIGDNAEPFALALLYAMNTVTLSPLLSAVLYLLPIFADFHLRTFIVCAVQAVLVCSAFFIQRKWQVPHLQKINFLPLFALSLSLGTYVGFSDFTPYVLPFDFPFLADGFTQKVMVSACIFLLSAVFAVALKCIFYKLLKCRLRGEEMIFTVVFLLCIGVGICRFMGFNAYMGIAFFALLVFAYATKDASALLCAFTLSLPPLAVFNISIERFFFYGVTVVLFLKIGRLSGACALLSVFFLFAFFAHARFAQLAAGKGVYIGYENGNILRGSSAVIGESELYDGIIVGIDAVMIIKRHPHAYYIPV